MRLTTDECRQTATLAEVLHCLRGKAAGKFSGRRFARKTDLANLSGLTPKEGHTKTEVL